MINETAITLILDKIIEILFIQQNRTVEKIDPLAKSGKIKVKQNRFNPYNPLSYVLVIVCVLIYLPLFGIIGTATGVDFTVFQWMDEN